MNQILENILIQFLRNSSSDVTLGYRYVYQRPNLHHQLNDIVGDWRVAAIINSYCATGSTELNTYLKLPPKEIILRNTQSHLQDFDYLLRYSIKKMIPTSKKLLFRTESSYVDEKFNWYKKRINKYILIKQFLSTSQRNRNKPPKCLSFEITPLESNSMAFNLNPIRKIIDPENKENEALYIPDAIFKIIKVGSNKQYKNVIYLKEVENKNLIHETTPLLNNYWNKR